MGSDLYDVTVLARTGSRVKLELKILNLDYAAVPADRSLALLLLLSPDLGDRSALSKQVSWADASRGAWMKQHARAYIADVKREPLGPKSVALEIGVTHPAWIEHVPKGSTFRSRALPNATTYARCAPAVPAVQLLGVELPRTKPLGVALTRLPGVDRATARQILREARIDETVSPEALTDAQRTDIQRAVEALHAVRTPTDGPSGFLWVPRALWIDSLDDADDVPELVSLPAYGPDAYVVIDEAKPTDLEKLRAWRGLPVRCGDKMGALSLSKKTRVPAILSYWRGYPHVGLAEPGMNKPSRTKDFIWGVERKLDAAPLGRLALRTGKRRTCVFSYKTLLPRVPGVVTAAKAKGNVLTLTLEHGPTSVARFASASASDMFWMLLQTLPGTDQTYNDGRAPLARATRKDGIYTLGRPFLKLSSQLASKYIEGFELERPKTRRSPDLDRMSDKSDKSDEDVKAFLLDHPFGTATLTIRVTDARWLQHVRPNVSFKIPAMLLPKPVGTHRA